MHEQPLQEAEYIPSLLDTKRDYRIDDLLDLADLFEEANTSRQNVSLAPADFKYALETKINRDYRAGSYRGNDWQSHPLLFTYSLDSVGKLDAAQFDDFYDQITGHIDYLESLGSQFGIVDIEIVAGNQILADVVTVVGYINTDLHFGYRPLPAGSYQVLESSFEHTINDRILFETLGEDEFWTDLYPNPSIEPFGLNLFYSDILGDLGIGDCLEYAGTLEIYGGQALVYGNRTNPNISMTANDANEYIFRGIHYIEDAIPPAEGMQLCRLKFKIGANSNNEPPNDCLPSDACNIYHPCFAYYHYWKNGFAARKATTSK